MDKPASIHPNDEFQYTLDEARQLRRERIRTQSRAVGAYVAVSPEARVFYEDWGTPMQAADDQ